MTTICDGLRVLEMGAGSMPASLAGMVLADNGARVLKVEPPEGDRLRTRLPSGFLVWNRGKESVVADLRTTEGQTQLRELAADADVVIEGFAPGVADGWNVGYDALREVNAGIVYGAISGFGRTGPYATLKAYEALVAAKVGVFARGAFAPRSGPIMFPQPSAGFGAAMQSTAGILAALLVRDRTGRGQRVDATMVQGIDPVDYFATMIWQVATREGKPPPLDAAAALTANRYGLLVCTKDGRFIQTSTMLKHQAVALIRAAGIAHVLDDPMYASVPMFATPEDAQAWEDLMWETFRTKDLAEWLPILESYDDIAFEVAVTSEEGLDHPQIVHNGEAITVHDPVVGDVRQVGPIASFSATPSVIERSAPALGQNEGPFERRAPGGAGPAPEADRPSHPLAGVTIVEFGYFYAMPYGTTMAAALGARVIKLEDAAGDPMRRSFGPELGAVKTMAGKESVSLDLRSAAGQEVARRLIAQADVFVTGFRGGVAERCGLGYEDLARVNPRLLYVHAAGYGADGPYARRALYAQAAQAVAGSFGRQVGYWLAPERNLDMSVIELQTVIVPRLSHVVDGDSNAALTVLAAITLGVYHQQRTGQGQFVTTSMIGGNAYAYSDDFCRYEGKPPVPICDSENYGLNALYRLYRASEGWVCLAVTTDREWRAFGEAVDAKSLLDDARFATAAARGDHDDELVTIIGEILGRRPAAEWEKLLTDAGVGCVTAFEGGQAAFTCTDPVLRETGLTVESEHPRFGSIVRAGLPVTFSETPGRLAPSCLRGEHNHSVLTELGYTAAEIAAFEIDGVLFPADTNAAG